MVKHLCSAVNGRVQQECQGPQRQEYRPRCRLPVVEPTVPTTHRCAHPKRHPSQHGIATRTATMTGQHSANDTQYERCVDMNGKLNWWCICPALVVCVDNTNLKRSLGRVERQGRPSRQLIDLVMSLLMFVCPVLSAIVSKLLPVRAMSTTLR